jgi:hypothetical protein
VDEFEIAVLFTSIDSESQEHLEAYIEARITP